jgi:hypothetical protein
VNDPAAARRDPHPVPAIAAGLVIDLLDLSLAGPLGIAGAVVAGVLVWWLARARGVSGPLLGFTIAVTAIYCVLPLTELVPLGTLVGAAISIADWRANKNRA